MDNTIPPFIRIRQILGTLSKFAFFTTLILLPARFRIVLVARPNGTLYSEYTDFFLFLPDICLALTLFLWGLMKFLDRKPVGFGPAYVWLPLAGLTVVCLLSGIVSVDRSLSFYHVIRFGMLFLFYLYIVNEKISIPRVGLALGLQGVLQALVAIAQSVSQRSTGLRALGELDLDPLRLGVSIVSDGSTRFLRAYGLTDHPNILGGCLAFGLMILLTLYLQSSRKTARLVGITFVLMCLALLLTFSRAAWLAFIMGAGLIVGLDAWSRRTKDYKPVVWLVFATGLVLLPFIVMDGRYLGARLNAGKSFESIRVERQSIDERAYLNNSASRIFLKHPIMGIGLSASPVAMKNEYPDFPTHYQPPHFTLLAVALETGVFGAACYFLLMLLPLTIWWRRNTLREHPGLIGAAGLLLSLTMVGFFDYYTWFSTPGRMWQWMAWGMFAVAMEATN